MQNLKPCPFCGKETQIRIVTITNGCGRGSSYACMTGCKDCGVTMRKEFDYSVGADKAVDYIKSLWNRRSNDERTDKA